MNWDRQVDKSKSRTHYTLHRVCVTDDTLHPVDSVAFCDCTTNQTINDLNDLTLTLVLVNVFSSKSIEDAPPHLQQP